MRKLVAGAGAFLLSLTGFLVVTQGTASAAVSGTTAVLGQRGSDFAWSCTVNPGGATVDVAGRSWTAPSGNSVDTAAYSGGTVVSVPGPNGTTVQRSRISGTSPVTLKFYRDAKASTAYQGRCAWYSQGTNTQLGITSNYWNATTGTDVAKTAFGAWTGPDRSPNTNPVETYAQMVTRVTSLFCQAACSTLPTQRYFPGSAWVHYSTEAGNRHVVTSVNPDMAQVGAGTLDATILAWLRAFPSSPETVYVTLWHEPDQNRGGAQGTASVYIAGMRHFADLVHQVKAETGHSNLDVYQVFMRGQYIPAGAWETWWSGDDKIDTIGFDAYRRSSGTFSTAAGLYGPVWQIAVEHSKPLIIPETSVFNPDGTYVPTEAEYAAFVSDAVAYLKGRAESVLWFEANKEQIDGKWEVSEHPDALTIWRAAVQGSV